MKKPRLNLTSLSKLSKNETLKHSRFSRANLVIFAVIFASIGGYIVYSSFAAPVACTQMLSNNVSASTISSTVANAPGGSVVCLPSGSWSRINLSGVAPASVVTLQPAPGATVYIDGITINGPGDTKNLTIQGFYLSDTINGLCGISGNVVFQYNTIQNIDRGNAFYFYANGCGGSHTQTGVSMLNNQMDHVGDCLTVAGGSSIEKNFTFKNNVCGPGIGYQNALGSDYSHYVEIGCMSGGVFDNNLFMGPYDAASMANTNSATAVHNNVFHCFGSGDNLSFSNNIIWHTQSRAQTVLIQSGAFDNLTLNNNLFVNDPACKNNGSNCPAMDVEVYSPHGLSIKNNTISQTSWGEHFMPGSACAAGEGCYANGMNMTLQNNIVESAGVLGNNDYNDWDCASGCVTDHNVSFDTSAIGTSSIKNWAPTYTTTAWTPHDGEPYAAPPSGYYTATGSGAGAGWSGSGGPQGGVGAAAFAATNTGQDTSGSTPTSSFNCYATPTAGGSCWTPATCTQPIAANDTTSLQTALNNAVGGAVICGSGTYGAISLDAVKKASDVTLQSLDPNNPATVGRLALSGDSHLVFQGLHIVGADVWGNTHMKFLHNQFDTDWVYFCGSTSCGVTAVVANADVVFDHNSFSMPKGIFDGRFEIRGVDGDRTPNGLTITNNLFKDGSPNACGDGLQLIGDASYTMIHGNEFTGLDQGNCQAINGNHTDPIQIVGAYHTVVDGNWFHDNGSGSGGFEGFDSEDSDVITNNVFASTGYPYSVTGGANLDTTDISRNMIVEHNVIVRQVSIGDTHKDSNGNDVQDGSFGNLVRDNVILEGFATGAKVGTAESYNLCLASSGCSGDHDINSNSPVFVGGATPTTYAGWVLAANSLGYHTASDGQSLGIVLNGNIIPPPPDPTPPTVSLTAPLAGASVSGTSVTLSANASDNVAVANVQFKVDGSSVGQATTSPYSISWNSKTVSNGSHTITAVATDSSGNSTTSSPVSVTVTNTDFDIGETTITAENDDSNANLLLAQQASLGQTATIQSMSFYVTTAAGNLRLGIYDSTGVNGGPGTKKAETAEFTPTTGWNRANVITPVSLPAGTYWLAYAPQSGSLGFRINRSIGTHKYYNRGAYCAMPTTYGAPCSGTTTPTINGPVAGQWSLFATFSLTTGPKQGDINQDNSVNITDLSLLLSSYGQTTTNCITNNTYVCDIKNDTPPSTVGHIDIFDLSLLLSGYGS
jgi:hypothetical protein